MQETPDTQPHPGPSPSYPSAHRRGTTGRAPFGVRPSRRPRSTRRQVTGILDLVTGRVETAVRATSPPGVPLLTPTGRGRFSVARYSSDGIVLLLGAKEAVTPMPWRALEETPDFLRGRGWVFIGSVYSTEGTPGTLDAHLKRYLNRATAGWVAVVLERAGVLAIDRGRPSRVKLAHEWT